MATMIERKAESERKEIAKLEARLARYEAKLEKAKAKAEKMDAVEFKDIWNEPDPENPMYRRPEHIPFVSAFFSFKRAQDDVEETRGAIERAKARLEKILPQVREIEASNAEEEAIANMESRFLYYMPKKSAEELKAEYEAWLAEFKAECLKDGIIIDEACANFVTGTTKRGKPFCLYINNGYTERSLHCYTLKIDFETIFTSGDFSTAYRILKR